MCVIVQAKKGSQDGLLGLLFNHAGVNPIPAPTNFNIRQNNIPKNYTDYFPSSGNIRYMEIVFLEYLGMFWARCTLLDSGNVTKAAIVGILKVYFPNFEHIETGKGLDSKM